MSYRWLLTRALGAVVAIISAAFAGNRVLDHEYCSKLLPSIFLRGLCSSDAGIHRQSFVRTQYPDLVRRLQPASSPPTPAAYTRGLAALNNGDFDAAIAEFTAAIADDPKDPFSYIRRATAYESKGDAASAIGDYRKVLKLVDAETGAEYAAKIRKLERTRK